MGCCSIYLTISLLCLVTLSMCFPADTDEGSGDDAQAKGSIPAAKLGGKVPAEIDNSRGMYMHSHPAFRRFQGSPHTAMHSQYRHSIYGTGRKRSLTEKMMKMFRIRRNTKM